MCRRSAEISRSTTCWHAALRGTRARAHARRRAVLAICTRILRAAAAVSGLVPRLSDRHAARRRWRRAGTNPASRAWCAKATATDGRGVCRRVARRIYDAAARPVIPEGGWRRR